MIIEKDVPMPVVTPASSRKPGHAFYPFNKMEIGDSVFFHGERSGGKASNAARKTAARKGRHFVVRREAGGIRIWRDA